VSAGHYENFPVASLLLPAPLRDPVAVIYRFARGADDLADEGDDPAEIRLAKLQDYRDQLLAIRRHKDPRTPLFAEVARIVREHNLPIALFDDLLDAFTQDVTKRRYANFAEVLDYCRRSANPVGRLLLHLFKRTSETARAQSDAICTSLQLINFWQDVAIDWAKDRVYLPQDDMRCFGVAEDHIQERRCDEAWRNLMSFQVGRTRRMMLEGRGLLESLRGRFRLEIALTVQGGLRILEKLEHAGFDMFRRRPTLKMYDWPVLLFRAV
jgi:phytoene synthase